MLKVVFPKLHLPACPETKWTAASICPNTHQTQKQISFCGWRAAGSPPVHLQVNYGRWHVSADSMFWLPSPPSVPKWGKVESSRLLSSAPLSKALLAAGPRHPRHEQSVWLGPSSSWGTCSGLAAGSWPEGLWSRAKVLGKATRLGFSSLWLAWKI